MALEPSDTTPHGRTTFRFEGADHGAQVSGFIVRSQPGEGPQLHRHPYEEIFILEAGTATFTVEGETVELVAGQMLVAPAGAVHRFVNSGDGQLTMTTIHPAPRIEQEDLPG